MPAGKTSLVALANKYMKKTRKKTQKRKYARASVKKSTIKENRLVAKVMDRVSESKIFPVREVVEGNGVPIQIGAQGYMYATVLGDVPSAWASGYWNSMGTLNDITNGSGHANRIGSQIFLKKTSLTLSVDCDARSDPLPMEFRTIIAKPRRSRNPTGVTVDPYKNLFMNPNGNPVGPGTPGSIPGTGITNPQLFNSMINLRDFLVYHDSTDTMVGSARANQQDATITTNHGPSYKGFFRKHFSLPHNVKVHFNQNGKVTNYDSSYFMIILARTLGQDADAGRWNMWLQGTTSYNDN
ncbi:MAG: putative capsid protein [Circoviridae sp.]|nr:MAG: putative capsid protein [Circoviridae sp.]